MQTLVQPAPSLEILDLRHFTAKALRPLLQDEAARWERMFHWNYTRAIELLLEYVDGRILPGYVAVDRARANAVVGFTFAVFEAAKAVIGDVYAFGEAAPTGNPICETLLTHQIETLQHTPGMDRIEAQLLLFPEGALHGPLHAAGFAELARLFLLRDLRAPVPAPPAPVPAGYALERWRPECYAPVATLIHRAYAGHMDANINDQYRTVHGSDRFLHNIIRFPGCGQFDPERSLVVRDRRTSALVAVILCSQVHADTAHITQLCVDPALRHMGLGRVLLQHCAQTMARDGARYLSLTVTAANEPAMALYQQLGFAVTHRFAAMVWDRPGTGYPQ